MNGAARPLCAAALLALAAGCVGTGPVRAPATVALAGPALAAATARVEAREAWVARAEQVAFSGRVALSNGRDGGNGRIEWWQAGDAYRVVLSAPVTRQSWRLSGDAHGARIEGLDGGPREGRDVSGLLLDATGMEIPVGALAAWAAGARADRSLFGPAQLHFDADGALVRLEQDGWTIDYRGWEPEGALAGRTSLPLRINAERGQARVRLVVDDWSPEQAGAAGPG